MSRDTDATAAMNALRSRFKADYAQLSWYRADWAPIKRAIRATTKLQAQYRQPRPNETARQAAARRKKNAALVREAYAAVAAL